MIVADMAVRAEHPILHFNLVKATTPPLVKVTA